MSSYRTVVSISYTDLFDDYETVNIQDLLREIPSRSALEVVCHFLGQLHTQERSHKHQLLFIQAWTGRLPTEVHQRINDFIAKRRNGRNTEFNFINNVSALRLIERILEDYNSLEPVKNLTPDQELQLFKAYLLCTQEWLDQQNTVWTGEKIETSKDLVKVIFPVQAPQVELIEFKDFRLQFIKAIYFFRFCEKDPLFSDYLQIFLDSMKFDSWLV